jgi:hypothetical protein
MKLLIQIICLCLPLHAWSASDDNAWFKHSLVGMEVGPTGAQFGDSDAKDVRYCARFDGAEIVRRCAEAGAEYVVLWARDGDYAYYDSKLLLKAPGLRNRDPLREAVAEGRKRKMPVLAYCVVQQNGHFLTAHPEYALVTAEGQRRGRYCYNSGYLEVLKGITAEQLAIGIDGFHLDMLDMGFNPPYGCWCSACQAKFQKEYGRPMPKGATWDEDWDRMLEFRYRSSENFEKELYRHIKSINPRASVDYNYHGNTPFSFEVGQRPVQHAGNGDFVTGETGVWGFSALTVSLNAEFYRASTPGFPFQVAMQRGVRMYHDQTTRPLNDLRWEMFTLLAHNAFVTVVDKTGLDGSLDPEAYDRLGKLFREVHAKKAEFGQNPVQEVGIYFSSRTRDWYGREKPAGYFQSFHGAQKAMFYEHIPWGILLDENTTAARLKEFPVVLLANAAILSTNEITLLEEYVRGGGKLIVTGLSGSLGWRGEPISNSKFEPLIGARNKARLPSQDNWARFTAKESKGIALNGLRPDWPFLVEGPALIYEPTTAKAYGQLIKPHRTTRQKDGKEGTEWPMSPDEPVGPAILLNRFGKGSVLTFACSPDFATGGEHHIAETRRLLSAAVRLLNPKPRFRITAPATVETIITEEPSSRQARIHLIGYNSPPQTLPPKERPYVLPGLIEDAPIFRATIETDFNIKKANSWDRNTLLKHSARGIEVTVEDVQDVITIDY